MEFETRPGALLRQGPADFGACAATGRAAAFSFRFDEKPTEAPSCALDDKALGIVDSERQITTVQEQHFL